MRESSLAKRVGALVAVLVVAASVAAVVIVVAGRGGGGASTPASAAQANGGDDGSSLSAAPGTGGGAASGGGHAGVPGSSPASTPGSGSGGRASGTPGAGASWFTVTLGATCVVPGGTQTLTAHSRAGYTVAFNSRYSDGKSGDTYGGFGVLPTDSGGVATSHWTVAANAPLGTVTLAAGTANGGPATTLTRTFTVAAHC